MTVLTDYKPIGSGYAEPLTVAGLIGALKSYPQDALIVLRDDGERAVFPKLVNGLRVIKFLGNEYVVVGQ